MNRPGIRAGSDLLWMAWSRQIAPQRPDPSPKNSARGLDRRAAMDGRHRHSSGKATGGRAGLLGKARAGVGMIRRRSLSGMALNSVIDSCDRSGSVVSTPATPAALNKRPGQTEVRGDTPMGRFVQRIGGPHNRSEARQGVGRSTSGPSSLAAVIATQKEKSWIRCHKALAPRLLYVHLSRHPLAGDGERRSVETRSAR
jgi:hypothetical protein